MRIIFLAAAICLGSLPLALLGYKEGPGPNFTGGFGEPSCHKCHQDNPLNEAGGALRVAGIPASYEAGRSYRITVTVTREGLVRGGFEIAARFASGKQAGSWTALDRRVQIVSPENDPSLQFAEHTAEGSKAPTESAAIWSLDWTAPATPGGPVQFNVAANASNDDASALGDFIYVQEIRAVPAK